PFALSYFNRTNPAKRKRRPAGRSRAANSPAARALRSRNPPRGRCAGRLSERRVMLPMGDVVDLDAYRAARQRRQRDEARRAERSRALVERAEAGPAKTDSEPAKDDPA